MLLDIVYLIGALIILVLAGQWVVKALHKISIFLQFSDFSLAFILMALSTTLPELFVGITSAANGNPALSLGNVIGSNIVNITLIAGIGIIMAGGYRIESKEVHRDSKLMILFAFLPMLLMFFGNILSRVDGIILVLCYVGYMGFVIRDRKHHTQKTKEKVPKWEVVLAPVLFIISLVLLFISSDFIVTSSTAIAQEFNIAPILIGLVLIALGTSLPELSFAISAFLNQKGELSLGNLIGAVVANSTLILGITAIISPITSDMFLFLVSGSFMLFATFLFVTFLESGDKFDLREGVTLIMLYVMFIIVQIYIPSI